MSDFEYIMVFVSLILGLGITQLLIGVVQIIVNWKRTITFLPHTLSIFLIFILHIQQWWVNYDLNETVEKWHFSYFVLMSLFPIILFIMSRLLFPINWEKDEVNLREFYLNNYRKFYLFGCLMFAGSIPLNWIMLELDWVAQQNQILLLCLMLIPVFFNTRRDWFHYGIAIVLSLIALFYVILVNPNLT